MSILGIYINPYGSRPSDEIFYIYENLIDPELLEFLKDNKEIDVFSSTSSYIRSAIYDIIDDKNFCIWDESTGNHKTYNAEEFSDEFFKVFITKFSQRGFSLFIPAKFKTYNLCKFAVNESGFNLLFVPEDIIDENLCKIALSSPTHHHSSLKQSYNICKILLRFNLLDEEEIDKFREMEHDVKLKEIRKDIDNLIKSVDKDLELLSDLRDFINFVACNSDSGKKVLHKLLADVSSGKSLKSCKF